MRDPNDGDMPAFPRSYQADGHNGMWLRDWFAGQALAGILAMPTDDSGNFHNNCGEPFDGPARYAYRMADAMLKARASDE